VIFNEAPDISREPPTMPGVPIGALRGLKGGFAAYPSISSDSRGAFGESPFTCGEYIFTGGDSIFTGGEPILTAGDSVLTHGESMITSGESRFTCGEPRFPRGKY
jgi:hypothetical protein